MGSTIKFIILFGITSLLSLTVTGCRTEALSKQSSPDVSDYGLPQNSKLVQYFTQNNQGVKVIKYMEADLNNDVNSDLIIIYKINSGQNRLRVVLDLSDKPVMTDELPAPDANQMIQVKDIDNKPPMELIIQGSKGGKIGYGIYRVEQNKLINIFGEGMEDCCS